MKFIPLASAAVVFVLVLSGCTTHHKDTGGAYLNNPASAGVDEYFTEYEIGTAKIKGKGSASVIFGLFHVNDGKYCSLGANPNLTILDVIAGFFSPSSKAISNAKNSAVYDAVESNRTDYLVGAVFSYTVHNYILWSNVNCNITAFPATVKRIVPAQKIILDKNQRIVPINPNIKLTDYSEKESVVKVISAGGDKK